MSRAIVVSVSVGTGLFIVCMVIMLCLAIGATVCIHGHEPVTVPTFFRPRSGTIGEVERSINELNYGPVNLDAAKEVKNGLFTRIRENRQSRSCATPQRQVVLSTQQVYAPAQQACVPVQSIQVAGPPAQPIVVDRTNCTYTYRVAQGHPMVVPSDIVHAPVPTTKQPQVAPEPLVEYPKVNPLESDKPDCPRCRVPFDVEKLLRTKDSTRTEKKTGSFICSHCKMPHVGEEWHTDWAEDGTPITFLCESCYSRMSPQQRIAAYQSYAARQTSKIGRNALLHQEIGE